MYLYLSLWKPKNYWLLRYVYQRLTSSPFKSYSINALQLVSRHPLPLRGWVKSIEASKGKRSIAGHLKCFFYTLLFVILLNQGVFDPTSRWFQASLIRTKFKLNLDTPGSWKLQESVNRFVFILNPLTVVVVVGTGLSFRYNFLPFLSMEKIVELLCFRFWLFFHEMRHLIARLQVVYNFVERWNTRACVRRAHARACAKFGDHTRGERLLFATPLALPILRISCVQACNWPVNFFACPDQSPFTF